MIEFKENVAYHCPTRELAKKLLKEADKQGYPINNLLSNWDKYEELTCYDFDSFFNASFDTITYYKSENYPIIEVTDEMFKDEPNINLVIARVEHIEKTLEARIKKLVSMLSEPKEADSKVDFSILNEEDVFWRETISKYKWLFKGENPFGIKSKCKELDLETNQTFSNGYICDENELTHLRLATPEEKEIFYKHFPEERPKRKVWIEVYEDEHKNMEAVLTRKKPIYEVGHCDGNGNITLEIIEREY